MSQEVATASFLSQSSPFPDPMSPFLRHCLRRFHCRSCLFRVFTGRQKDATYLGHLQAPAPERLEQTRPRTRGKMAGNETDVLAGLNAFLEGVGSEAARDGAHAGHAHHDHGAHGSSHSTHGGGMEHQGHDMSGHHMMKMWFHGGVDEVILFDFWRTSSCFGLFVSCLAIFVMGAVYEGVKWFRVYLQLQRARQPRGGRGATGQELLERDPPSNGGAYGPTATPPCHAKRTIERREPRSEGVFSPFRIAEALLYSVQLVLAYWLMLIVMTYNTWLTVAVIAGAGFGHWLFATLNLMTPKSDSQDSFTTDACH